MNATLLVLALNLTGGEGSFELPLTLASDPRPARAAWRFARPEALLPEVSPFSLELSLPDRDILVGDAVESSEAAEVVVQDAPSFGVSLDFDSGRFPNLLTADRSASEGMPLTSWIAGRMAQEPAPKPTTPSFETELPRQDPWNSIVRTNR